MIPPTHLQQRSFLGLVQLLFMKWIVFYTMFRTTDGITLFCLLNEQKHYRRKGETAASALRNSPGCRGTKKAARSNCSVRRCRTCAHYGDTCTAAPYSYCTVAVRLTKSTGGILVPARYIRVLKRYLRVPKGYDWGSKRVNLSSKSVRLGPNRVHLCIRGSRKGTPGFHKGFRGPNTSRVHIYATNVCLGPSMVPGTYRY